MQDMLVPMLRRERCHHSPVRRHARGRSRAHRARRLGHPPLWRRRGRDRPFAARLPRLAIVDSLAIDNKRRLVLVRRDNVEHLVLIGGPSDVVVEPSIVRQRVAQRPGQATPTAGPDAARRDSTPGPASAAGPCACAPRPVPRQPLASSPAGRRSPRRSRRRTPFPSRRGGRPLRASDRLGLAAPRNDTDRDGGFRRGYRAHGRSRPCRGEWPCRRSRKTSSRPSPPPNRPRRASRPRCTPPPGNRPRNRFRAILRRRRKIKRAVSAFAPPDADQHDVLEPVAIESEGPGEADDAPGAPPTAEMRAAGSRDAAGRGERPREGNGATPRRDLDQPARVK